MAVRLTRGALVWCAGKGAYLSKPRPAVIVQASAFVAARESVTVCPLTSDNLPEEPYFFRVRLQPNRTNGLERVSARVKN